MLEPLHQRHIEKSAEIACCRAAQIATF